MTKCEKDRTVLDAQQQYWNNTYLEERDFFGEKPSYSARKALEMLKQEDKCKVLELGAGQGRDALFFAKNRLQVYALDYSENGVETINHRAQKLGLSDHVRAVCHDIRKPLPFDDESFDGCYCHMFYCMALCTSELEALFEEVKRVLKPNGMSIYTVRNTADAHYGQGIPRGEDMYEVNGFIVHFFDENKIKHLAKGYEVISIEEFEEGELPRKLFLISLRKK